jgi:hypothetical protein
MRKTIIIPLGNILLVPFYAKVMKSALCILNEQTEIFCNMLKFNLNLQS